MAKNNFNFDIRSIEDIKNNDTAVEETIFGDIGRTSAMEISLDKIQPFKDHPFKVTDNEDMSELIDSISKQGVLLPVIVRETGSGSYELISGHRRTYACRKLGLSTVPAKIVQMNDEDAVIAMVDSNIQRTDILPSEKAFAFKAKMDAIRIKKENGDYKGISRDIAGKELGISGRQIERYIKLTNLIPCILDMVDNKKINFELAGLISDLGNEKQQKLYDDFLTRNLIPKKEFLRSILDCNSDQFAQELADNFSNKTISTKTKKEGWNVLNESSASVFIPSDMPLIITYENDKGIRAVTSAKYDEDGNWKDIPKSSVVIAWKYFPKPYLK